MRSIEFIQVPSDLGSGRRGAGLGVSALYAVAHEKGYDIFKKYPCTVVPVRNEALFNTPKSPYAKHLEEIFTVVRDTGNTITAVLERGSFPIILAGDHSTAAGSIIGAKLFAGSGRLGVIWIDAHADLHTPYTTPTGNVHGMPVAAAAAVDNLVEKQNNLDEGTKKTWEEMKNLGKKGPKIALEDFILISGRSLEDQEKALMEQHNTKNFTVQEIRHKGIEVVAEEALQRLAHCDYIYVSFDVDSMDPSVSQGTGTPVPDGLIESEARALNQILLRNPKVIVWEMVEINPLLDTENKMARVALDVLDSVINTLKSEPELRGIV